MVDFANVPNISLLLRRVPVRFRVRMHMKLLHSVPKCLLPTSLGQTVVTILNLNDGLLLKKFTALEYVQALSKNASSTLDFADDEKSGPPHHSPPANNSLGQDLYYITTTSMLSHRSFSDSKRAQRPLRPC
jgi:hypothetical protein